MDFFQNLTDDQMAIMGCFVALAVAGLLMSLSYYLGGWQRNAQPQTHRLPQTTPDQDHSSKAA